MKTNNILCSSLAIILALASCKAQSPMVVTNAANIDKTPIKTTAMKEADLKRWSHLDLTLDTVPGMSIDKAYKEILKNKKGVKVIVGIVDSGVDIEHEDLKSVIWTNKKEVAGNGIDDDKNGYVDDVNGWNFLGKITKENLEYERIMKNKNLVDEVTYLAAKSKYDKKVEQATQNKSRMSQMITGVSAADVVIAKHLNKPVYTGDEVNAIDSKDTEIVKSKTIIQRMLSFGLPIPELKKEIQKELDGANDLLSGENLKKNYRAVVGDNPDDIADVKYGDSKVMGPEVSKEGIKHGTHVAGIVAQVRYNNKGGDGVASNNVQILTVRAVPDGDEYDKDIALGIRYAVDNGAKIINGSFGKDYSPHKQWVYDAIKYAASKDVLIVHAAGNDSKNIDIENNFPNDSDDKKTEFSDNLITVGALNFETGSKIVADFSNYGKLNVDVFAPGTKIYASTPNNSYEFLDGTSMAAPNVAGIAALIRSYYPKLTATQVKHILMDSGTQINSDVIVGGDPKDIRKFSELSTSGRIANAYNALIMAGKISKK